MHDLVINFFLFVIFASCFINKFRSDNENHVSHIWHEFYRFKTAFLDEDICGVEPSIFEINKLPYGCHETS